jgi:antitoxin component of MazEF toxin-antitoxin module
MKQKVIKIGSSIGVVLSKSVADELGFKAGQDVQLHIQNKGVFVEPVIPQAKLAEKSIELATWLEDAVERYRPALEALKNA